MVRLTDCLDMTIASPVDWDVKPTIVLCSCLCDPIAFKLAYSL